MAAGGLPQFFLVTNSASESDASGSLWTGNPFHHKNLHLDVIKIATNITVMTSRHYTDPGQLESWDGLNFDSERVTTAQLGRDNDSRQWQQSTDRQKADRNSKAGGAADVLHGIQRGQRIKINGILRCEVGFSIVPFFLCGV